MLKILYFSEGYHFFQISLGIKSLYDRGSMIRDREDNFSKFIDWEATGAHSSRALGQGVIKTPQRRHWRRFGVFIV